MRGDVDIVLRRVHGGMLDAAAVDRARQRARRQAIDRRGGGKPRRSRHADHLQVLRLRRDEVGLGDCQLRSALRQARFRLRHVGAGDLAGVEAVAGLAQRHFEHVDVAALELEDRRVAEQIHVGGRGVEQDGLLGGPQGLAGGEHLALGLARAVRGLEAVEERLGDGHAGGRHGDRALRLGVGRGPRRHGILDQRLQIILGDARRPGRARAVARQRRGHGFVDRAGGGALGVELGIVLVGLDQRGFERGPAGSDPAVGDAHAQFGRERAQREADHGARSKERRAGAARYQSSIATRDRHAPHPVRAAPLGGRGPRPM